MNKLTILALLPAFALAPPPTAFAEGFCVEDADDVLWLDCEEAVVGATRQTRVLCRRAPGAALTPVEPARRLAPGEGRCPEAGGQARKLSKDEIPRRWESDEPGREHE